MKHWLLYKLRFLGFKRVKYFGVFKDPKIRVTLVFLRYGSKVNERGSQLVLNNSLDRKISGETLSLCQLFNKNCISLFWNMNAIGRSLIGLLPFIISWLCRLQCNSTFYKIDSMKIFLKTWKCFSFEISLCQSMYMMYIIYKILLHVLYYVHDFTMPLIMKPLMLGISLRQSCWLPVINHL